VVAAPVSTIDFAASDGAAIAVEHRPAREVTTFAGNAVAPPDSAAYNPAFDVTDPGLVTALVTERGIVQPVNAGTLQSLGTGSGPGQGAPSDVSVER
jgi:methylthioribose-1-phosphate isomerase